MDTSLIVLGKFAFIAAAIGISYGIIWIISKLFKGKMIVDSYAAINGFLYLGLIFNLFAMFEEPISRITVGVILVILFFRYKKSKRLI